MQQVDLIRRFVLKKCNELRIFVSCLPTREDEALQRLYGHKGAETAANIADFVLVQLGHVPPEANPKQSPTMRAARKIMPGQAAMPVEK